MPRAVYGTIERPNVSGQNLNHGPTGRARLIARLPVRSWCRRIGWNKLRRDKAREELIVTGPPPTPR
jgi:hypothetical protein